jgi:hypothetical protein
MSDKNPQPSGGSDNTSDGTGNGAEQTATFGIGGTASNLKATLCMK